MKKPKRKKKKYHAEIRGKQNRKKINKTKRNTKRRQVAPEQTNNMRETKIIYCSKLEENKNQIERKNKISQVKRNKRIFRET